MNGLIKIKTSHLELERIYESGEPGPDFSLPDLDAMRELIFDRQLIFPTRELIFVNTGSCGPSSNSLLVDSLPTIWVAPMKIRRQQI